MNSFTWKTKDSYLDYGIIINKLPPISKAERDVEEIPIPGRDGDLTVDYATHKAITFPIGCTLLDFTNIDTVKAWLDGFGDVAFSWIPGKTYKAKLINKIDIEQTADNLGEFPLIFKTQPHGYSTSNSLITLTTSPATVTNLATVNSKPIIKVYGTGTISLTINSKVISLINVVDYVTIDSYIGAAYKDLVSMNNNMTGDFPELIVGINNIAWSGTVSKIEITPGWRYL